MFSETCGFAALHPDDPQRRQWIGQTYTQTVTREATFKLESSYGPNQLKRLVGSGVTLGLRVLAIRWKVSLPEFPK